MLIFRRDELRDYADRIFAAIGMDFGPRSILVDHLIEANLAGHDTHGVRLIGEYLRQVRDGTIQPNNLPSVRTDRGAAVLVDGQWGFGHVAARYATELAISRARERGVCLVGIVHCNHTGRLGEYAAIAARAGVALITLVGSLGPHVAPYGSKSPRLTPNPIAIGFPAGRRADFIHDFATSSLSGGRIMIARETGETLPPGNVLDKNGDPTTDPNDFFDGGVLLPFGGHKGYGLAVAAMLLSEVLIGEAELEGEPRKGTHFLLAIDGAVFRSRENVEAEADAALDQIAAAPPAPGFEAVRIPGDSAAATRDRRLREGIPLHEASWRAIREAAASVGVTLPEGPARA